MRGDPRTRDRRQRGEDAIRGDSKSNRRHSRRTYATGKPADTAPEEPKDANAGQPGNAKSAPPEDAGPGRPGDRSQGWTGD